MEIYYVIKKNKYYGGDIFCVGMKKVCHYSDCLRYAKMYDTVEQAENAIKVQEEHNGFLKPVRGKWSVRKIEIREIE